MTMQDLPPVKIGANNQVLPDPKDLVTGTLYRVPNDGAVILIFKASGVGATLSIKRRAIGPSGIEDSVFAELAVGNDWVFGPFPPVLYSDSLDFTVLTGSATCIPLQLTPIVTRPATLEAAKGEQGDQGPVGPEGPEGAQGPQGLRGPQGTEGAQGVPGETGPRGLQGKQGDKGDAGATGPTGGTGPMGMPGQKGDKGDKGDTGAGVQGPQGLRGLQGPQGQKGDKGDKGDTGPQGPAGGAIEGSVSTDGTLTGAGTHSDPLKVANPLTPEQSAQIGKTNTADEIVGKLEGQTGDSRLDFNALKNRPSGGGSGGGGLESVATGPTLVGNGTEDSPLGVNAGGTTQDVGTSNAGGSSDSIARRDHRHRGAARVHRHAYTDIDNRLSLSNANPVNSGTTPGPGVGTTAARADHNHAIAAGGGGGGGSDSFINSATFADGVLTLGYSDSKDNLTVDIPSSGSSDTSDFIVADVGAIDLSQPWIRIVDSIDEVTWTDPMVSIDMDALAGRELIIYNSSGSPLTADVRIIFDFQHSTDSYDRPGASFTIKNLADRPLSQWYAAPGAGGGGVGDGTQVQYNVGVDKTAYVEMDVISTRPIAKVYHVETAGTAASYAPQEIADYRIFDFTDGTQNLLLHPAGQTFTLANSVSATLERTEGRIIQMVSSGDNAVKLYVAANAEADIAGKHIIVQNGTQNAIPLVMLGSAVQNSPWTTGDEVAAGGSRLIAFILNSNTGNIQVAISDYDPTNSTDGTADYANKKFVREAAAVKSYPIQLTGPYWDVDMSGGETDILIRPKGQGQTYAGAKVIDLQDILNGTQILRVISTASQVVNVRIYANAKSWVVNKTLDVENLTQHPINLIFGPDLVPGNSPLTEGTIPKVIDHSRGTFLGWSLDSEGNLLTAMTQQGPLGGGVGDFASKDYVDDRTGGPRRTAEVAFAFADAHDRWQDTGIAIENGAWYMAELVRKANGVNYPLGSFSGWGLFDATAKRRTSGGIAITSWVTEAAVYVPFAHPDRQSNDRVRSGTIALSRMSDDPTSESGPWTLCLAWYPQTASAATLDAAQTPTHIRLYAW